MLKIKPHLVTFNEKTCQPMNCPAYPRNLEHIIALTSLYNHLLYSSNIICINFEETENKSVWSRFISCLCIYRRRKIQYVLLNIHRRYTNKWIVFHVLGNIKERDLSKGIFSLEYCFSENPSISHISSWMIIARFYVLGWMSISAGRSDYILPFSFPRKVSLFCLYYLSFTRCLVNCRS